MAIVIYVFNRENGGFFDLLLAPHLTFQLCGLEAGADYLFNTFMPLSFRAHGYFHISKTPLHVKL